MRQKHFSQDPQNTCKEKHLQCVIPRNIQQTTRGNKELQKAKTDQVLDFERGNRAFTLSEMHENTHTSPEKSSKFNSSNVHKPTKKPAAHLTKLSQMLSSTASPQI